MRDPMSWAIPVFRAFGIPVKVHVLFFLTAVALCLRAHYVAPVLWWGDIVLFTVVLVFGVVLLHELGHCFAGRAVGGEPTEILLWPLGGLASVDTPQNWRAHTVVAAGGPAVNLGLCVLAAAAMAAGGFLPNPNPNVWSASGNPYLAEVKNYRDGRVYTSPYGYRWYRVESPDPVDLTLEPADGLVRVGPAAGVALERAVAPVWIVWLQRLFWVSWVQFLFNLLPAYPLDGGQILQGLGWWRYGYRQGTTAACYSGYGVGGLLLLAGLGFNESFLVGVSLFMLYTAWTRLHALDADDGVFGYDFSAGYTSLERDAPPPPRPRRAGLFRRWAQARAARRLQREAADRQRDEERFDQLLEKIHHSGKGSLSADEQRFLERVSARYRNRS